MFLVILKFLELSRFEEFLPKLKPLVAIYYSAMYSVPATINPSRFNNSARTRTQDPEFGTQSF